MALCPMNTLDTNLRTATVNALAALRQCQGHIGILRELVERFQHAESQDLRAVARKLAIIAFMAEQNAPQLRRVRDMLIRSTIELLHSLPDADELDGCPSSLDSEEG